MTWASVSSTKGLKTGTIKFSLINGEQRSGSHTSSMVGNWYKIATLLHVPRLFSQLRIMHA